MKTTTQNKKSELKSRTEQVGTRQRPQIDFKLREANRSLDTQSLLALLQSEAPNFFDLAEVVGKWVWIQFDKKQPGEVTCALAELGFHWNNVRQTWQHPCGSLPVARAIVDPRQKYRSYFAAAETPA